MTAGMPQPSFQDKLLGPGSAGLPGIGELGTRVDAAKIGCQSGWSRGQGLAAGTTEEELTAACGCQLATYHLMKHVLEHTSEQKALAKASERSSDVSV